jgi:hypothetical protein
MSVYVDLVRYVFETTKYEPGSVSVFNMQDLDSDKEVGLQVSSLKTHTVTSSLGSNRFDRVSRYNILVEAVARLQRIIQTYSQHVKCKGAVFCIANNDCISPGRDTIVETCIPLSGGDMCRARWRRVHLLADAFWNRWRTQFLQSLQERRKWRDDRRDVAIGDVVLLKDKQVYKNHWPM